MSLTRGIRVASVALAILYAFNVGAIHRLALGGGNARDFGFLPWSSSERNGTSAARDGAAAAAAGHVRAVAGRAAGGGGPRRRISVAFHDPAAVPRPDAFALRRDYLCRARRPPPPPLAARAVLGFTVTLRTDLRVGFVGDSIAAQFSQAFDAAALGGAGPEHDLTDFERGREREHARRWALYAFKDPGSGRLSQCLTFASPLDGGGASAFLRVFDRMSRANMRDWFACDRKHNHDLGWSPRQAETLKGLPLDARGVAGSSRPIGKFDAFVMRLTHGWLTLDQITREMIVEQIELLNQHLGAETIVVSTLPVSNNVRTLDDWHQVARINQMVRELARDWTPPPSGEAGVRAVLVQEFGNFTSQLVWTQARRAGWRDVPPTPDFAREGWELERADFLFARRLAGQGKWAPSKAHVCATNATWRDGRGMEQCELNRLSVDGSHWCQDFLGPRHSASIACLLGCVYNGVAGEGGEKKGPEVRRCERECNDQFMSIIPVQESWIGTGVEVFSS